MYRGRNFHFQTEYCSLKELTLNNESYLVFTNWQNLNFLLADYFKDMIYNQNRFGNQFDHSGILMGNYYNKIFDRAT